MFATAWWIRASDGAIEPVIKHDLWLKNHKNLEKWGLESLIPTLDRLTANQEDEIRMIGLQAGLIRVRNYAKEGTFSVQFSAPRSRIRRYLEIVHKAIEPYVGGMTNISIGNLNPSAHESINVKWFDFDKAIRSGKEIMTFEHGLSEEDLIQDIPYSPKIFTKIETLLRKNGVIFET